MFWHTCTECRERFPLAKAKLDPRWNSFSPDPAYAYCPHCEEILEGVSYKSVDLARTLTPRNAVLATAWLGLMSIGLVTGTLNYVGTLSILALGIVLVASSKARDHRVIGWILIVLSVAVVMVIGIA